MFVCCNVLECYHSWVKSQGNLLLGSMKARVGLLYTFLKWPVKELLKISTSENIQLPSLITEHSTQAVQAVFRKKEHWLHWIQHNRTQNTLFTACWRQEMRCSAHLKRCSGPCSIRPVNSRCDTPHLMHPAVWSWNRELMARVLNMWGYVLFVICQKYKSWGDLSFTFLLFSLLYFIEL